MAFAHIGRQAKAASSILQKAPGSVRTAALQRMRDSLLDQSSHSKIIDANNADLTNAEKEGLDNHLIARLKLTPAKIESIASGLAKLADTPDPIGRVLEARELSNSLIAKKEYTPLGALLVIFESRPDALPQIASLAIRSGNAVVLKGGKEATHSNTILHSLLSQAVAADGNLPADAVQLVHGREPVGALLKQSDDFALVIPRGSNALVSNIKANTEIPVMGHADGVCHVFVDKSAPLKRAVDIVVDSKCDYPAACNAMETLLLHRDIAASYGLNIVEALVAKGVTPYLIADEHLSEKHQLLNEILKRPAANLATSTCPPKHEFGTLECHVQVVEDVDDATEWVRNHGSAHTDSIVATDDSTIALFKSGLESACVFTNASTRFADGHRLGLGAEVGVATGRLHARGPVGIEGLMTYRWTVESSANGGHTLAQNNNGEWQYTWKDLPIATKAGKSVVGIEDGSATAQIGGGKGALPAQ